MATLDTALAATISQMLGASLREVAMPEGLYRDETDWVVVHYDTHRCPIPRAKCEEKGYKPPYESLPTKEAYQEAKRDKDARWT